MGRKVQAVQRNAPAKRNARRKGNAPVSERLLRGDAPVWMDAEQVSEWVSHDGDCGIFAALAGRAFLQTVLLRLFRLPARLLRDVPEKAEGFPS